MVQEIPEVVAVAALHNQHKTVQVLPVVLVVMEQQVQSQVQV
jgi:hypothetical protein